MNRNLITGTVILGAVVAIAATMDSGHLSPYVKAMSAAKGLDVTYSVSVVGGSRSQYHIVLAKPDKALIETPSKTYVADGENITVYDKGRNTYFVKEQDKESMLEIFEDEDLMIWRSFFDAKAFDKVASTSEGGSRMRRGEKLNTVTVQIDEKGEFTMKLHISDKDNLVRQAELISMEGSTAKRRVLSVSKITTSVPDSDMFVFNAPADAKELTEAELNAEWSTEFDATLENAATFGKGVIIDFYADW